MTDNKKILSSDKYGNIRPSLEKAIKSSIKNGTSGGLLHISIDNLPMVISSHGGEYSEETMDNLLHAIAETLAPEDIITRSDINHLKILLNEASHEGIKEKSFEIHRLIQGYGCTNSLEPIQLMATIGSVDFPDTAKKAQGAINKAYIALNDAQKIHKHYLKYKNEEKHSIESKNQMILASYIQSAFLNNKLRLAFQPIVDSGTGEIAYYESLLRIINDDGSATSAGPFIPIAEKMGFIDAIDIVVLNMVVDELHKTPDLKLAVNVSNASMNNSTWLSMAVKLLSDPKIASRLTVEIIETSEQHNVKKVIYFINTLQNLGCRIALDDFGTGYTSFSQLKSLPVDIIKIDGSFVRDIAINKKNRFFVNTLLEFSKSFGLKTVAEFVENQETADILIGMNVDYLQGNFFSPAVNYRDWVSEESFY